MDKIGQSVWDHIVWHVYCIHSLFMPHVYVCWLCSVFTPVATLSSSRVGYFFALLECLQYRLFSRKINAAFFLLWYSFYYKTWICVDELFANFSGFIFQKLNNSCKIFSPQIIENRLWSRMFWWYRPDWHFTFIQSYPHMYYVFIGCKT